MLTILLCRDQSAGTDAVLEQIAADVSARRGNRILMVPELISHDVERRLCKVAGDQCITHFQSYPQTKTHAPKNYNKNHNQK